jgi:site-specific recombinase XerD
MPRLVKPRPYYLAQFRGLAERLAAWEEVAQQYYCDGYRRQVPEIVREFFGVVAKPMEAVTAEDADAYVKAKAQLGTGTLRLRLTIVQGFLRFFGLNPKFDLPRSPHRREDEVQRQLLTPADVERVLQVCQRTRDRALVSLLWETALRISEALAVRWTDVDFERMTVFLQRRKGGASQQVPFGDLTAASLIEWRNTTEAGAPEDYVFSALGHLLRRKHPLKRRSMGSLIARLCQRAGLRREQMHPHAFRHSCATYLLAQGMNLRQVQHLLGHSNVAATAIYAHVLESDLTDTYARIHRRTSNVGLKAEGEASKPPEKCPSCGGLRLPYHRVCPCGYDYQSQNPELVEKQTLFMQILQDPEVTRLIEEKLRTIIRKDRALGGD